MAITNAVKKFADLLTDSIIIFNPALKIMWCNGEAKKLLRIKDNLDDVLITDLIAVNDVGAFLNLDLYQTMDSYLIENVTIHLSLSFIQKTAKHFLVRLQNVTHLHYLEKMRQDFVANVSHELRTPLTVIHGYLETLLDSSDDRSSQHKIFTQMYQQSLRMEKLVEDLLLLSRLEAHSENLTHHTSHMICIPALIKNICHDAQILSGKRSHKITLALDEKLQLYGEENEIHGAFSNIIFNAVHYTPAAGSIHIAWFYDNNSAQLIVRDSGIGICAEDIPRITERFYRVDKARSRESGGTGLGLAIVKHVLIRHEARLEVESEIGKGSSFRCIFPKSRTTPR